MSILYAFILPTDVAGEDGLVPAADPANWTYWPASMIPVIALGLFLARRVWNAKPKGK